MSITIYKNLDSGKIEIGYRINIEGDDRKSLIWEGLNAGAFKVDTGLDIEEHLPGLYLEDNQVKYSQEQAEDSVKPTAYGRDLLELIRSKFSQENIVVKGFLFSLFQNFELEDDDKSTYGINTINIEATLQASSTNPISRVDFDLVKALIQKSTKIEQTVKNVILLTASEFESSVRFVV